MKRTAASALQLFFLLFFVTITTGVAMAQPFAYVANGNSNSVSGYSIAPRSGVLTQLPGSAFGAGSNPDAIQFTPDAKYAYVANSGAGTLSAYSLNGTNGALTPIAGSPFPTDGSPITLAISPSGKFLYTGNSNSNLDDNGISAFSIDGATGALIPVPGSPFFQFKEYFPGPFAFTPSGTYLYASSVFGLNSYIAGFAVNADGSLTELTGSPFSTSYPNGLAVSPSGNFLFVGDYNGFIEVYSINGSTGTLTLVSSVPTLDTYPVIEVTTSEGEFLYGGVIQFGNPSGSVNGFQIDTTTGGLTAVPGSPFPAGSNPQSLAGSSSGRFLYVANAQSNDVSGYSVNAATGTLTPVAGSPFATGSYPESIALADPVVKECGALNVSREATLTPGPYTRQPTKSDLFDETLTITNGITAIPGPLSVALLGLPSSTTTLSGTYKGLSTTYCFSASGNYVVPINSLLPPGNHGVLLPDEVLDVPFVFQATEDGHAVKPTRYVPKLIRGKLDK